MKILVVDDEKLLVKGIKFNLENEGYTVDACYDGEEAVNAARTGEYDLIILDLMMPKKDGLQACQEIRSFSTVPIIMLTARSEKADLLMGFESGAVGRRILYGADDKRPTVALSDVNAESAVLPFHFDLLLLELRRIDETGVRILPGGDHPADGAVQHLVFGYVLADRVYLIRFDNRPGLLHEPQRLRLERRYPRQVVHVIRMGDHPAGNRHRIKETRRNTCAYNKSTYRGFNP